VGAVEPFDTTVERDLDAGYALFELCQDEDVALEDTWDDNDAVIKVAAGRVGIESAAPHHYPEIALASYQGEPEPVADGFELVGLVEVEWETDHVELWTSGSDIGAARQLTLPPSPSGRYRLRAARARAPQVQGALNDWMWAHGSEDTHGLERWRFEFWPAA
jgi:hypothetical protein